MGVIKKPPIKNYWSTKPLLQGPAFSLAMSRDRYMSIMAYLHFADNELYNATDPSRGRLYKIRYIIEYLVGRFKFVYLPGEYIAIDEELVKFRGRLTFKQFIKSKRA